MVDEPWWESWVHPLRPYAVLMRLLIDGRISGQEFETVYLPLARGDSTDWPPEYFKVLDEFFADVDEFFPEPERLTGVAVIGEEELRRRATVAFQRLSELGG